MLVTLNLLRHHRIFLAQEIISVHSSLSTALSSAFGGKGSTFSLLYNMTAVDHNHLLNFV